MNTVNITKNSQLSQFYRRCKNIKKDINETENFQFFQQGYRQAIEDLPCPICGSGCCLNEDHGAWRIQDN